jgi:hypothetical protein
MKKYLLIFFCIISFSSFAQLNLGFREFCCKNTTEWGNDEIYFLISAKFSNGNSIHEIFPDEAGNIYMNDDKGDHICIGSKKLLAFTLNDNESVLITVTIMEQDGDSANVGLRYKATLTDILDNIDNNFKNDAVIISKMKNLFPHKKDTDDWIGSFEVFIKKTDGILYTNWHSVSKLKNENDFKLNMDGNNTCYICFESKRPKYQGWFFIK